MGFYLAGKLLRLLTLLVAICAFSFLLLEVSPIDPVRAYVGADMLKVGPEQWQKIAEYWGLDRSLPERFVRWGVAVMSGDLGISMIFRRPVLEVIGERFLASLALMLTAWTFSGIVGFILGVLAAMKQGTWTDRLIKWYCFTLASTPLFWLGLLMLLTFAVWLGWFPVGLGVPAGVPALEVTFADRLHHLLLPALTLSITGVAGQEGYFPDEALLLDLGIKKEWLRRWPNELSAGELQRFCVARALGPKTRFLLADKMTTMLDAVTQAQIWRAVLKIAGERRLGVLVTSHDEQLIKRLCNKRIIMAAERI